MGLGSFRVPSALCDLLCSNIIFSFLFFGLRWDGEIEGDGWCDQPAEVWTRGLLWTRAVKIAKK